MEIRPKVLCGSSKTPSCLNTVPPVVIDSFSGQTVIGVERVHTA
jgi:hypothetical protein